MARSGPVAQPTAEGSRVDAQASCDIHGGDQIVGGCRIRSWIWHKILLLLEQCQSSCRILGPAVLAWGYSVLAWGYSGRSFEVPEAALTHRLHNQISHPREAQVARVVGLPVTRVGGAAPE